jgi:hypothetical protein
MIETDCNKAVFGHSMGKMGSLTDVRVETMEHDDHSYSFALAWIAVGGKLDGFSGLVDGEFYKIQMGKGMIGLGIGMRLGESGWVSE